MAGRGGPEDRAVRDGNLTNQITWRHRRRVTCGLQVYRESVSRVTTKSPRSEDGGFTAGLLCIGGRLHALGVEKEPNEIFPESKFFNAQIFQPFPWVW